MVKNIKFIIFGFAALSLGACDEYSESYSKGWEKEFRLSCLDSSIKSGASGYVAKTYCDCVAADLFPKVDGVRKKVFLTDEIAFASADKCLAEISATE